MAPMRVLVLFGGRSGEHEVSVTSARMVVDALTAAGHDAVCVGITRDGRWVHADPRAGDVVGDGQAYRFDPDPGAARDVDVVFPVLHGPHGEDGSVQGLCELAMVPFVGAGVEGSVVAVNKALNKRLLATADLPVVEFVSFTREEWRRRRPDLLLEVAKLGFPCFAKPAHLGSSVGISQVTEAAEAVEAVERALMHDDLVLVEAYGGPRELEVGALEVGDDVELSVIGEVIPDGSFYDYEAKYRSTGTDLLIPAPIEEATAARLHDLARRTFRVSGCEGLARIDFFYDPAADRLVVNELNTIPGLTPTSMFPRVWEASGRPFTAVVEALLEHALRRHTRRIELEAARTAGHRAEVGPAS